MLNFQRSDRLNSASILLLRIQKTFQKSTKPTASTRLVPMTTLASTSSSHRKRHLLPSTALFRTATSPSSLHYSWLPPQHFGYENDYGFCATFQAVFSGFWVSGLGLGGVILGANCMSRVFLSGWPNERF